MKERGLSTKLLVIIGLGSLAFSCSAWAQKAYGPGANDREIRFGQTMSYSGPNSAFSVLGKVADGYFRKVNDEGGINGRKLNFISYDDAYNPAKTVEQTRRLVESDDVLFTFGSLGTSLQLAVQKYLNAKRVPQLFVLGPSSRWEDYEHFPWTIGITPSYRREGRVYAHYALREKPGGKIAVEIAWLKSPDSDTRLQPSRSYVKFGVTDTGAGIPEEKLLSIFDPFVQAESGHARSREGSGLGLTISRRLARLMGGDLTVKSEVGKGSTFTLWLPADTSAKDTEAAPTIAGQSVALQREVEGLGDVGRAMFRAMESTIEKIVDRIRTDPNLSVAAGLKFSQLADHLAAMLADIGGALVVMEEAKGSSSPTLADAVEIQRLISERHGAQRERLGWSESAVRREFMIVREELEKMVRHASEFGDPLPVEDGIAVIGRFLDQAEYIAVRALNAGHS